MAWYTTVPATYARSVRIESTVTLDLTTFSGKKILPNYQLALWFQAHGQMADVRLIIDTYESTTSTKTRMTRYYETSSPSA